MSAQPPTPEDPLAALAKAAHKAVTAQEQARESGLAAQASGSAERKRLTRTVSMLVLAAALVGIAVFLGPRLGDPYYDEDPLGDPQRAQAYVAGLLDDISAYRARNGGKPPATLELAVPENRLPPRDSPYKLDYRVDGGVPVVTLQGGREPVTVRGAGK